MEKEIVVTGLRSLDSKGCQVTERWLRAKEVRWMMD